VQISDPVDPLPIVITTLTGMRPSVRAAAVAEIIRDVYTRRQR
jgi:hypothetical protein